MQRIMKTRTNYSTSTNYSPRVYTALVKPSSLCVSLSLSLLLSTRHTLHLLTQCAPIIRLQFSILDAFLSPLLMQSANMVLTLLKEDEFVADTFADEDATGVLLDNGFLVLTWHISPRFQA